MMCDYQHKTIKLIIQAWQEGADVYDYLITYNTYRNTLEESPFKRLMWKTIYNNTKLDYHKQIILFQNKHKNKEAIDITDKLK